MREPYPPVEPYGTGTLDVGDGNRVYWETCGNPDGRPALVVHGGPGSGCGTGARRLFDPERYPERVSQIVVSGVTTARRSETDWLHRGVARFLPEQWERFAAGVPDAPRDGDTAELPGAYARLTEHPDAAVREKAAADWCAWKDAVVSGEPYAGPAPYGGRPSAARLAVVRICAHHFSHGAWPEEGALLRGAGRPAGIPGVLVHGRLDLSSPLETAWRPARAWPDAEPAVVGAEDHLGGPAARARVLEALDGFARR
ncbi:prolyl aminopeptidase [Streptomyces sp. URMC 125]|uniref:prolyl aminopeptidase n=1 Tax=Streptomyces sp. URMC 125 TaxID=3423419 RepID=UPI003F1AB754